MSEVKKILIKGGTIVLGPAVSQQDILIEGERIAAIGKFTFQADEYVDATDLLVLPGAIDTHVHFDDEFMGTVSVHDYYTGTRAAAYGGVTSVIDFSNQIPGEPLMRTIEVKKEAARDKALIDWGVHPVITNARQEYLDEIPQLVREGAPTIKCYMTYRKDGLMMSVDDLRHVSQRLRDGRGMLIVHAEDNAILESSIEEMVKSGRTMSIHHARSRPAEAENQAIRQCIRVAEHTNGRIFIVHLASATGMDLITKARARGVDMLAETCTHYLVFTEDILERIDGMKWICSPPLRDKPNQDRLWEGLYYGAISMVSSDDAAYSWTAKQMGKERFDKCPNGIAGIEVRLPLLYSEGVVKGRLTLPRLVEIVSTKPANLFGLAPRKGSLAPGSDADIVLFDPEAKWTMGQNTLHMATDYSSYEDIEITGKIRKVFSRVEMIIDGDECLAEKGRGRYLHRKLDMSFGP
ncbi:MAG: dihydropyrimidinase [Planctomycetes bacterium]|nr:dihydropyrimidinase [Planctomycetota bacterium]